MKKIFEEPKLQKQTFAVEDQLLLSSITLGEDETNLYSPFGGDAFIKR